MFIVGAYLVGRILQHRQGIVKIMNRTGHIGRSLQSDSVSALIAESELKRC